MNSRNLLLSIFSVIISTTVVAQPLPLSYAVSQGGTSYDSGKSIAVDNLGNSYTAGIFAGTADLDPSSSTMNFTSAGSYDGFVSKLDVNGQLVWAFSLGSTSSDEVNSITIDGNGDIIVVGSFQGIVDFDPSGNTSQLGSVASADVFVAKYTPNGDLIWAKQMGGNSADIAFDVETDSQGNVYTTGHFYATADFDPDNVGTANLTSNGQMDVFVSKLDVNGDFLWVKQIGGSSEETGTSISIDGNGDVIVGGNFWGTVDFDPDGTTNNVTSNGGSDAFGLKLNNNGAYLNVVKLGGAGNEYCLAVDSDGTNNIYLGGQFSGTMDINPLGTANNITSNGGNDIFMLKYNQNFQLDWGYGFGDVDDDAARGIKVDANSNAYLTGYMRGTVDFDPGAGTDSYTSNGSNDIFLLKVDAFGAYQWSTTFGSATNDSGYEIGVWNSSIFVVGDYSGTVDFDPSPNNYDLVSAGSQDIFTLALGCLTTTGTDVQTACDSYLWIDGNTYTSDNNTATHTLTNAAGCDSTVTLDLTITNSTSGTDIQTVCDTYTWIDGNTYTSDNNTATHTLTNAAGCDSVVTLDLTITSSTSGTDIQTVCDTYTWIDGNTYTSDNNTATHTLTNAAGCDSVVTLDLTITSSTSGTDVQTVCDTYTWIDGNTYTSDNNTATHTLTNAAGCDSVVTLDLTITSSTSGTDIQTVCDTYTWIDGNTYTSDNNTATHTLTNATGCDSVVTLDLTIQPLPNTSVTQNGVDLTVDQSGANYEWYACDDLTTVLSTDQTYTATVNGGYLVSVSLNGCSDDSQCVQVTTVGLTTDELETVSVYPNPSEGLFKLKSDKTIEGYKVYNAQGELIKVSNTSSKSTTIDLRNESKGLYFLHVNGSVIKLSKQ